MNRRGWLAAAAGLFSAQSFGGNSRVSHARNENGVKAKLYPDADNWAALQTLLDVSTHVTLPAGEWPISRTLQMGQRRQAVQGQGVGRTTLRLYTNYGGPVIGIGAGTRWSPTDTNYFGATGMMVRGLTLHQQSTAAGANCLYVSDQPVYGVNECNELKVYEVRVRGAAYEGIVAASSIRDAHLKNIEAWDCGNGGPAYALSTAGINATCGGLILEDFRTLRCGQGVETGNSNVIVRRGVITEPGAGTPGIGVNIGSTGWGIYDVEISDCKIYGYDSAIAVGNGIGRLTSIRILRNLIHDEGAGNSPIEFQGGQTANGVANPFAGPDLSAEGSFIEDNVFEVSSPHQGAISYNTGPADLGNPNVYGREKLTVRGNIIRFVSGDTSLQTNPLIGFAGNITGDCLVTRNRVYGLPTAPSRGDVQSYTNNQNAAVQGMPNLSVYGNDAYLSTDRLRDFSVRIEGA